MMTPDEATQGMLAILNEGVANLKMDDLTILANGLLMAKNTPGALQIGNMLHQMVALNKLYSESIGEDPNTLPGFEGVILA